MAEIAQGWQVSRYRVTDEMKESGCHGESPANIPLPFSPHPCGVNPASISARGGSVRPRFVILRAPWPHSCLHSPTRRPGENLLSKWLTCHAFPPFRDSPAVAATNLQKGKYYGVLCCSFRCLPPPPPLTRPIRCRRTGTRMQGWPSQRLCVTSPKEMKQPSVCIRVSQPCGLTWRDTRKLPIRNIVLPLGGVRSEARGAP